MELFPLPPTHQLGNKLYHQGRLIYLSVKWDPGSTFGPWENHTWSTRAFINAAKTLSQHSVILLVLLALSS